MPKGLRKPVFGVGINDYPGTSSWMINGVRFKCPLYRKWVSMLGRCYKEEYQAMFLPMSVVLFQKIGSTLVNSGLGWKHKIGKVRN